MSTAAVPGATIHGSIENTLPQALSTLAGNPTDAKADLTIHRISKTHHGRTLLVLGHAAEHLANSRRFACERADDRAEAEAIHLLMGLSRMIFDEFAKHNTRRWKLEQWVIGRVAGMIEGRKERPKTYQRAEAGCITC